MSLRIGLTYDLRKDYLIQGYSQEDVAELDSEETVASLDEAIRSLGHTPEQIGNAKSLCARLAAGDRWDLVFNIAEGLHGRCRESQVPCLLEIYEIGYTFSDPLVCAATLDKSVAKRLVREYGLPTAEFKVVKEMEDIQDLPLHYPLFAKPVAEGTGKGIDGHSRVESQKELAEICQRLLARFRQPVLVEEFLPGSEFTLGVLGTGKEARVLGTMEIAVCEPQGIGGIYSFDAKAQWEQKVQYAPLRSGQLRRRIEDLALKAYRVLECRDAARVDFRLGPYGEPNFMEINPLPGLHAAHSDLPMIARQEGVTYEELIAAILNSALSRLGVL